MCRGLKDDDGKPLIDLEEEPWKFLKISTVKPSAGDYKEEIERRNALAAASQGTSWVQYRPKAWILGKVLQWLDEHPISAADDVAFLKRKVEEQKQQSKEAADAKKMEKESLEKSWTGSLPYLRLIHCLIEHDEIKSAFLRRYDIAAGRMEMENRNSTEKKSKSVCQMIAEKWNDPLFEPTTEELPEIHSDFINDETIFHHLVEKMSKATAEKCEGKFSTMIVELNRVIGNWEKSGQGEGGVEGDDDDEVEIRQFGSSDYGTLKNRSRGALDQRHSFVKYSQSYLLYLWHMLDKHNLLGSSLQRLNDTVAASNGGEGVPSVIIDVNDTDEASLGSKKQELARLCESIQNLSDTNMSVARMEANTNMSVARMSAEQQEKNRSHERSENLRQGIDKLKVEKRHLCVEMLSNKKNKPLYDFLKEQVDEIEKDTEKKEAELLRILGTPKRNNRTPESAN